MKHDVLISGCMTNSRKFVMLLLYFLKIFLYPNAVLDVSQIFVSLDKTVLIINLFFLKRFVC